MKTFLYYSDLKKPEVMITKIRERMIAQARVKGARIVGVAPREIPGFDVTVIQPAGKMPTAIFTAIMAGLDQIKEGTVYFCEDDVIYHDGHFELPHLSGEFTYDLNLVHLCPRGFFERHNRCSIALSHAWGELDVVKKCIERKIQEIKDNTFSCYEPAGSLGYPTGSRRAKFASIDVRHSNNNTWKVTTEDRFTQHEEGWPSAAIMVKEFGIL